MKETYEYEQARDKDIELVCTEAQEQMGVTDDWLYYQLFGDPTGMTSAIVSCSMPTTCGGAR